MGVKTEENTICKTEQKINTEDENLEISPSFVLLVRVFDFIYEICNKKYLIK